MSVTLTFEAATSKDLYAQLVKFIESGATSTGGVAAPVTAAPAQAVAAKTLALVPKDETAAPTSETLPPPTPAVLALIKDLDIPEEEWVNIPRSGKGQRITQGDVNKYASGRLTITVDQDNGGVETEGYVPTAGDGEPAFDVDKANKEAADDNATGADQDVPAKTEDEVKVALGELYAHDNGGRAVCFEVLSRYGTKKVGEVPKDQLGVLFAKIQSVMAGEPV